MPLFRPTPHLLAGRPKTAPHEIPPPSSTLPAPRSADQADKYFRRVANENVKPGRGMRLLSVGGWVVGGGEFRFWVRVLGRTLSFLIPRLGSGRSSCVVDQSFIICNMLIRSCYVSLCFILLSSVPFPVSFSSFVCFALSIGCASR